MKTKDALLYCRQLLFEARLTGVWLGDDRLRYALALQRWRDFPAEGSLLSFDEERRRWREELQLERTKALETRRNDVRQLERMQARLDAAEGVVAHLRVDNEQLREDLVYCRQAEDLEGELEQMRLERSKRAAAGARAVVQEAELRTRLEAEERRLADSTMQLAALEVLAEEDESTVHEKQASELVDERARRETAITELRAARGGGSGSGAVPAGRVAWRAAFAQAQLELVLQRHAGELAELEERLEMLQALRESKDALEYRVTETKAQLIVMRSAAETASG